MIAWEGYIAAAVGEAVQEADAAARSTRSTRGSSDEMVTLMRSGGGSQYDMVSASGDASLRLIYGKDVQAVDPSKIPDFKNFGKAFQSPPNNTVGGKHYGISLQWGPNTLLYNTKKVKPAPTSWAVDLRPEVQGQDHRSGQPDPDRRRGAVPDEDPAVARDQGSVRAELDASSTRRSTCSRSRSR